MAGATAGRLSAPVEHAAIAPVELDRRFEALIFDWDGTAVPDRGADATRVRSLVEELCARGMDVYVVTGTHVGNVDGQLHARPRGPGRLYLCLNRGSEVFGVGEAGPEVVWRREATSSEDAALTQAADRTVRRLAERGLRSEIVSQRLNRRKIDLIPEPAWADPPKARIDALLGAVLARLHGHGFEGLPEVVALALEEAAASGLRDARVTSDAKHVEIGLTDKSDSARWAFGDLWRRGIGPGLVLVGGDELGPLGGLAGSDSLMLVPEASRAAVVSVGVEPTGVPAGVIHLGGGPEIFCALLDDQLRRRVEGRVPGVDADPEWSLVVDGWDDTAEPVRDALLTLADGVIGSTGGLDGAAPRVLAAGTYEGEGPDSSLVSCPAWQRLPFERPESAGGRRVLDLRTGVLWQRIDAGGEPITALGLSSLDSPGTTVLRAEGPANLLRPEVMENGTTLVTGKPGGVAVAVVGSSHEAGGTARVERLAAYVTAGDRIPREREAADALERARRRGFDALLAAHRAAWARRWERADIRIEGDAGLQRDVRFALFHLMSSVASSGQAAVGARGLSGPGYRGHVFWDADVFVLPFFCATHPEAARAMLEYRYRHLPQAKWAAASLGHRGARFPWESAATGADVTPPSYRDRTGRVRPIRNALSEEHIVADVAWAAACYEDWTADEAFARGPGRELITETARWWASRIRADENGRGHLFGVIGPDEYHEPVDDDAFTNVMARWNLKRAASASNGVEGAEPRRWLELAGAIVDNYDPASRLYEQFAGYFGLDPLTALDVHPTRPFDAQALLGERLAEMQIIKQADVLMLHHLVPDEVASGSLRPNIEYYEPRTSHGSSLSPGVHASLLARAGRTDEALDLLRRTARIDLDDVTGSTAAGLHLATMGSLWQAIAFGFAGLRPAAGVLRVDPRPAPQIAYEVNLLFTGIEMTVRVEPELLTVTAAAPVVVSVPGTRPRSVVDDRGLVLRRKNDNGSWEVTT